jgi:hypothetical protein
MFTVGQNAEAEAEAEAESESEFGNESFSVSTDWSYLYLLGKIAIKHKVDVKLGVQTLADCLKIQHLLCADTNNKLCCKTKYWISVGLLLANHKAYLI